MRLNIGEFESKKIAVNCRTREDAEQFLKMLSSFGKKWSSNTELTKFIAWEFYEEETCYHIDKLDGKVVYCSTDYYKHKRVDIVKWSKDSTIYTMNEPEGLRVKNDKSVECESVTAPRETVGYLLRRLQEEMQKDNISIIKAEGIFATTEEKILNSL